MIPDCIKNLGEFSERLLTHDFVCIDGFSFWKDVYICTRCQIMIKREFGVLYYGWRKTGVKYWVSIRKDHASYILYCDEAVIKDIIE